MGFWHTGYMEFHEESGLGETGHLKPQEFVCPHCGALYSSLELLRHHRFDQHPYVTPQFFVRGREVGKTGIKLTSPVAAEDFVIERSDRVHLNGQSVNASDLPGILAGLQQEKVKVLLSNEGASAEFDLTFAIATPDDVAGVEAAFMRLAKGKTLTLRTIEGFIDDCRPFYSAREFCDGVCHYLYGVLAKERAPETGISYERYTDKFTQAATILMDFDRPLSRLVRGLVGFHFNHFEEVVRVSLPGRLQLVAKGYLEALTHSRWPVRVGTAERFGAREDLLTDNETLRILQWAGTPLEELSGEIAQIESFVRKDIPDYDRFKLRLLLAELYAASGDFASARRCARELLTTNRSSSWAERLLDRLAIGESSNE